MINLTIRSFSKARWLVVATNRGVIDANGNDNPGFVVNEIGPVVLKPAVLDGTTVITPAVVDTWYWIMLTIHGDQLALDADTVFTGEIDNEMLFLKSKFARWVRENGTQLNLTFRGQTVRVYQFGATTSRVQLLDPRDYLAVRVLEPLGGYSA